MTQTQTDYNSRNDMPQEQYTLIGQASQIQPVTMLKRIGSTTYRVAVHFSKTSTKTMNDKIIRLIKNEAAHERAAGE